jgi:hypothetical protein
MSDRILMVTESKVREAAAKCSTAKAIFETLFPEVFQPNFLIEVPNFGPIIDAGPSRKILIERRNSGEYRNKGFFLTEWFDWSIVKDTEGESVLVPTPKRKKLL